MPGFCSSFVQLNNFHPWRDILPQLLRGKDTLSPIAVTFRLPYLPI